MGAQKRGCFVKETSNVCRNGHPKRSGQDARTGRVRWGAKRGTNGRDWLHETSHPARWRRQIMTCGDQRLVNESLLRNPARRPAGLQSQVEIFSTDARSQIARRRTRFVPCRRPMCPKVIPPASSSVSTGCYITPAPSISRARATDKGKSARLGFQVDPNREWSRRKLSRAETMEMTLSTPGKGTAWHSANIVKSDQNPLQSAWPQGFCARKTERHPPTGPGSKAGRLPKTCLS